jgi:hypothetical protein
MLGIETSVAGITETPSQVLIDTNMSRTMGALLVATYRSNHNEFCTNFSHTMCILSSVSARWAKCFEEEACDLQAPQTNTRMNSCVMEFSIMVSLDCRIRMKYVTVLIYVMLY